MQKTPENSKTSNYDFYESCCDSKELIPTKKVAVYDYLNQVAVCDWDNNRTAILLVDWDRGTVEETQVKFSSKSPCSYI